MSISSLETATALLNVVGWMLETGRESRVPRESEQSYTVTETFKTYMQIYVHNNLNNTIVCPLNIVINCVNTILLVEFLLIYIY